MRNRSTHLKPESPSSIHDDGDLFSFVDVDGLCVITLVGGEKIPLNISSEVLEKNFAKRMNYIYFNEELEKICRENDYSLQKICTKIPIAVFYHPLESYIEPPFAADMGKKTARKDWKKIAAILRKSKKVATVLKDFPQIMNIINSSYHELCHFPYHMYSGGGVKNIYLSKPIDHFKGTKNDWRGSFYYRNYRISIEINAKEVFFWPLFRNIDRYITVSIDSNSSHSVY